MTKKKTPYFFSLASMKAFLLGLVALSFFKTQGELTKGVSPAFIKGASKSKKKKKDCHVTAEDILIKSALEASGGPYAPLEKSAFKTKPAPVALQHRQKHKPTLLKTKQEVELNAPVENARMSSQFGYRTHPILKTRKLHKGVDFAAKIGTPIRAAADGKIVRASYTGGYGHYVRIQHGDGRTETAYAHLHKYKPGLKVGKRVKKNDIIGYVGTSGRSTGPHLHFELLKDGKHINPKNFLI